MEIIDQHCLPCRIVGPPSHPVVLFLHGFMGSSDEWTPVMDRLVGAYRGIAVDLPGHGKAVDLDPGAYTMEGAARRLVDVLDAHGVDRCAVVGYSMGGRLALYFALRYPQRCRALVLESASPGLRTARERRDRRRADEARAARLETDAFDTFLDAWYRQPVFASLARQEGLIERLIDRRRANRPRELARSLRGMGTGRQPSQWERLATLRVSACAVAGALDEKYVDVARRMAAASPCMRVAVVPGAGHNVHVEQPDRYLALLHTFLTNPEALCRRQPSTISPIVPK